MTECKFRLCHPLPLHTAQQGERGSRKTPLEFFIPEMRPHRRKIVFGQVAVGDGHVRMKRPVVARVGEFQVITQRLGQLLKKPLQTGVFYRPDNNDPGRKRA